MSSRRYSNLMRKAATLTALIVLLGQTIAAAHFHPSSTQRAFSASGVSGVADSACPICAAHLHSTATAPIVPALDAPAIAERTVPCALETGPLSTFVRNRFGRAPPT